MTERQAKPIYILYGQDEYLKAEYRKQLVSSLIGPADPQTAVTVLDDSATPADVLDGLRTAPFLAPLRVIIVSPADEFVSSSRQALEKYAASPCPTSALILCLASWPKNTRLHKLVAEVGQAVDCSPPERPAELASWVVKAAGKRGKSISPQAARLLADLIGPDVGALDEEVEKLALYVGSRGDIGPADISLLVTAAAGPHAFALSNAIAAGDTPAALKALASSLTRRGDEFKTLGQIAWHLRKAMAAQQAIGRGEQPGEACRRARVFGDGQRAFLDMLKRHPLRALQNDFRGLLAADLDMKTGGDPVATLQDLVVDLCR